MKVLDYPPVWFLALLALAWAQAHFVPLPFPQPLGRDIGALSMLVGLFFMLAAVRQMMRQRTTLNPRGTASDLITTGVFAKSRNPIYLGDTLLLAGLSLWMGSVLGLILVPVFMTVLTRRFILAEESRLRGGFGQEYEAYARETRRWL